MKRLLCFVPLLIIGCGGGGGGSSSSTAPTMAKALENLPALLTTAQSKDEPQRVFLAAIRKVSSEFDNEIADQLYDDGVYGIEPVVSGNCTYTVDAFQSVFMNKECGDYEYLIDYASRDKHVLWIEDYSLDAGNIRERLDIYTDSATYTRWENFTPTTVYEAVFSFQTGTLETISSSSYVE